MDVHQKNAVNPTDLRCIPQSNLSGSLWIVEAANDSYAGNCIIPFPTKEDCVQYINNNNSDWDEFAGL